MLVKTTTSPATLVKYSGSGLAKSEGTVAANTQIIRAWENEKGKQQRIALDISNANVEVIDSLEQGSNLCVIKVNQWSNSTIRQIDSLLAPLAVSVQRNGKTTRSFSASNWKTLSASNLSGIQDGDVISFSLNGVKKIVGFTLVSLDENSLKKEHLNSENLIPTKQDIGMYPNPFNPTTTFRISLPEAKHVQLLVYNMLGQKVATVVDDYMQAGYNEVRFNGSSLASGMYLYRMQVEKEVKSGRMILMK